MSKQQADASKISRDPIKEDPPREVGSTSASRLLRVAKRIGSVSETRRSVDGWSDVLRIPTQNKVGILKGIYDCGHLITVVQDDVNKIEDIEHRLYLGWVPKLLKPFEAFVDLSTQMVVFTNPCKDEMILNAIEICHDLLRKANLSGEVVEVAKWSQLLSDVREAIKSLQQARAELPPDLFALSMRHLLIVEQSLVDYQLHGPGALVEGFEGVVGLSVVRKEDMIRVQESAAWPIIKTSLFAFALTVQTLGSGVVLLDRARESILLPEAIRDNAADTQNDDTKGSESADD